MGKMTDVAVVEVVIKSSKKLESKERCRHKKKDLEVVSVLIDSKCVNTNWTSQIHKSFSLKVFLYSTFQSRQPFSLVLPPKDF